MSNMIIEITKAFTEAGSKYLSGCVSSSNRDLQGDTFSLDCLQAMQKTAMGVPLATNHDRNALGIDDIGTINKSWLADDHLFAEFRLNDNDPRANALFNAVQKGVKCGFSVGGKAKVDSSKTFAFGNRFAEFTWDHCIPTTMPVNEDTKIYTVAVQKSVEDLSNIAKSHTITFEDISEVNKDMSTTTKTEAPKEPIITEETVEKSGAVFSADTKSKFKSMYNAGSMDEVKNILKAMMDDDDSDLMDDASQTSDDDDATMPDAIAEIITEPDMSDGSEVKDDAPSNDSTDTLDVVMKAQIAKEVAELVKAALEDIAKSRQPKAPEPIAVVAKEVKRTIPAAYGYENQIAKSLLTKLQAGVTS